MPYPERVYLLTCAAAAIMHMIQNNLDPRVAQFPQELITYGGNGSVFSNWYTSPFPHRFVNVLAV